MRSAECRRMPMNPYSLRFTRYQFSLGFNLHVSIGGTLGTERNRTSARMRVSTTKFVRSHCLTFPDPHLHPRPGLPAAPTSSSPSSPGTCVRGTAGCNAYQHHFVQLAKSHRVRLQSPRVDTSRRTAVRFRYLSDTNTPTFRFSSHPHGLATLPRSTLH